MTGTNLVILGTASQAPTRTRNHNGYLLRWDNHGLLFDPGEGTQRQLLFAGVPSTRITRILLTHLHGDHCLGLPGVLQRMTLDQARDPVPINFPASGEAWVERLCSASLGRPTRQTLEPVDDSGGTVTDPPLQITAQPLAHRVPTLGWRVEEPPRWHLLPDRLAAAGVAGADAGRLLAEGSIHIDGSVIRLEDVGEQRRGRSFAIVMDTAICDEAVELAEGVDLLLCEATYLESEVSLARDYRHLTAREAATIAREANVGHLVLSHFSSRYPDASGHVAEAAEVFPAVTAASDLEVIPLRAGGATPPPL